ncbi:hypothetical protein [Chitinimonas sp. BJYL2]|uniref:hypothetical protein n=1 Tax=Chitinimonas sp. BJYL2 TaxID=2976696 RepID=UPI0022B53312|nr:hypothetical protein [Chitinimonas sp. BJYL2]
MAAKLKLSRKLFVLDIFGAVLAGLGMLSLMGEGAQVHPVLADPVIGGVFVVIGVGLMAWFMLDVLKRIRAARMARGND